ncbi:transglutaminase family protein [Paraflavisolibacter sp. H34]|uniref:transglutaminase-like domain-containing protein n=1 Tax=Huijunlia imazamoxiresistens TaxID=3127457 RepID=UPI003019343B
MKFEVTADLSYTVQMPSTLMLNIHALRTPNQTVLEESFTLDPYVKAEELTSSFGENRFIRIEVSEPTDIRISYKATVDNCFRITDQQEKPAVPIAQLGPSVFPYLYPSRYCQSDKLYRFAYNKFGAISDPYEKVVALSDWIFENVEYLSGSTNWQTSAYDTVTELAGVCRDFAHLGIALCRSLSIPARYFTGYAYQLNPPDFHACFEAYLGGEWILFDATRLAPLNGLIKIATGRDAADTAVASIFGKVTTNAMTVGCTLLEENFQPFFNEAANMKGIACL